MVLLAPRFLILDDGGTAFVGAYIEDGFEAAVVRACGLAL